MTEIRTSSTMSQAEKAQAEKLLNEASRNAAGAAGNYSIVYDPAAPSWEAYAKVGEQLIKPMGDPNVCAAIYQAALAAGVPQPIAYAAYLACLAS